ncbi:MAG TPA: hypothetical protein VGE06_11615, partial [Flavisolibacter sp.]
MRKKYFSIRILHCIWIGCLSIYFTQQLAAQKLDMVLLDRFANSPRREMIKLFYQLNQENPAWIGHTVRQKELLSLIEQAYLFGLNEADYQVVFLHHYFTTGSLPTREDSIEADIRFTDAALHLFSDIKGGSVPPTLRYQGLTYTPDLTSIAQGLKKHLETGQLKRFFHSLQPRSKEYEVALQKLNGLQRMQNQKDIGETSVRSTLADSTNRPLLVRLYQLGITDRGDTVASKKKIKEYITAAQDEFDLVKDGKLGPVTLRALNTTLKRRIDALK